MYAETLRNLIDELQRLPGIGPKSAQRLAFYILRSSRDDVHRLAQAMIAAKDNLKYCSSCFNITDVNPCEICTNESRDQEVLCVVAEPKDLMAIERSREFKGKYHVLGGMISPLDDLGPENLRILELMKRLQRENFKEIVLALSPTTEGEATNIYLTKLIKPLGIKLTRVAYGLPIGADMDYADEATLSKAFEGRREV
ncbi:recombination protein RecR [candidate division WOR-1 bacterium RIFOXYB2_FULL_42_35]|uniref:Recombination protein RecR n=1 Tax=candidate division WOR-1 bacterium RIFOXYC2_FULL_41_25 TaxID=1802586 RepID=A0A1F4TIT4_UNCSA|nr:MAG: recombination protein RecR [candidate division WOR-1 bacterium RIFOXYA2_FULL_41_14]OGC21635.1 MAG: recombination protein RecR [candidate division WOR-1 bacterium RIFOXYB2_FULL_42_35]OGC32638.1 MAG: recombination protein RecR [candidate division WOR-1 bacterium RIFOXYC2_FULL_41_25]OGC41696.1 MAG: recombination protein RecR [candidate division WOR-1 bacterium RIFOXYD2_FULL_41_8]